MQNEEIYKIPEKFIQCKICNKIIEERINCIPNVMVITEDSNSVITIDMKQALNIIDDYCYHKYYHLSASQIILFRPDIAVKAFKQIFKKIISFGFEFRILCNDCYKNHCREFPLK